MNIEQTLKVLQDTCLAAQWELLHPDYATVEQDELPLNGYCYILAEGMYHLFPGTFDPCRIMWPEGGTHWFLRYKGTGKIMETIINQPGQRACTLREYSTGTVMKAFRSPNASKRTMKMLGLAGLQLPGSVRLPVRRAVSLFE